MATSIACAPYAAYGLGTAPIDLPKLFTNVAPNPVSDFGGWPATLMYAPLATAPFAFGSENPSGVWSWIFGFTALMSCISFAPLLHAMPPRNTACAPELLIWFARASYEDCFASQPCEPTTFRPSFFAAASYVRATPTP